MSRKDIVNVVLFILLAWMIIIASRGGFGSPDVWSVVLFNIGIAMLGGVVCAVALFGLNVSWGEGVVTKTDFARIRKNQDMGEKYWVSFINSIDKDPATVWFVGNRHSTWIDKGLTYRNVVKSKLISRVTRFVKQPEGGDVRIVLTDEDAVDEWKEFIQEEVALTTNYDKQRPGLIKIGLSNETDVRYSIVAHGKGLVITPYTSGGRAADSPTFEVQPESKVADLYLDDLRRIGAKIAKDDWWQVGADRKEGVH